MTRAQAERKIARQLRKVKPCPFCGATPKFSVYADTKHSERGSWGYYAVRERCCTVTASGQTELFFCNDWMPPNYGLWWSMTHRMIAAWNRRVPNAGGQRTALAGTLHRPCSASDSPSKKS